MSSPDLSPSQTNVLVPIVVTCSIIGVVAFGVCLCAARGKRGTTTAIHSRAARRGPDLEAAPEPLPRYEERMTVEDGRVVVAARAISAGASAAAAQDLVNSIVGIDGIGGLPSDTRLAPFEESGTIWERNRLRAESACHHEHRDTGHERTSSQEHLLSAEEPPTPGPGSSSSRLRAPSEEHSLAAAEMPTTPIDADSESHEHLTPLQREVVEKLLARGVDYDTLASVVRAMAPSTIPEPAPAPAPPRALMSRTMSVRSLETEAPPDYSSVM